FVDVEGWYRITPYEAVVASPYDLGASTTAGMAAALPSELGAWHQAGPDQDLGADPAVTYYLKQPTVALQRTYQDGAGQEVDLVLIGNRGQDSFLLFSHTPETCYPGRLWQIVENRRESAFLDERQMVAQYLLTRHAESGEQLLVLYWYLWQSPARDPEDGVLSLRVNVRLAPGESPTAGLERAWDLVRALFPATVAWERF
ncbi:MAG TPA: EpsI family protein, partial [Anaerolineae bacterium]|nr:EpsI family protein [Anaerolineae bacterium]